MDSKSATTSAEHHDNPFNMTAAEFENPNETYNEAGLYWSYMIFKQIAKQAAERRSNPESLKRNADVAQQQVAKLQRISPEDQTSQLKESVQVLENKEALQEDDLFAAESVAFMAERDSPSKICTTQQPRAKSRRIRIVPDDHPIFAGLPDIIVLPDLGNTCMMHGGREI